MEVESGGSQQFLEEGDGVVPFPGVQYGPDIPAELAQVTSCFLRKYFPYWTEEYFMQNTYYLDSHSYEYKKSKIK